MAFEQQPEGPVGQARLTPHRGPSGCHQFSSDRTDCQAQWAVVRKSPQLRRCTAGPAQPPGDAEHRRLPARLFHPAAEEGPARRPPRCGAAAPPPRAPPSSVPPSVPLRALPAPFAPHPPRASPLRPTPPPARRSWLGRRRTRADPPLLLLLLRLLPPPARGPGLSVRRSRTQKASTPHPVRDRRLPTAARRGERGRGGAREAGAGRERPGRRRSAPAAPARNAARRRPRRHEAPVKGWGLGEQGLGGRCGAAAVSRLNTSSSLSCPHRTSAPDPSSALLPFSGHTPHPSMSQDQPQQ
ncbi:uncharacterized protein GJ701_017277 [Geothlypis trichas]